MNRKMIIYTLGRMLILEGLLLLLPIITSLVYREFNMTLIYSCVAILASAVGYILSFKKPNKMKLYAKEGFVIVALTWTVLSIFGALPFYISKEIPSYISAFFEIVSGFTTTGSSILTDVEALSHTSLFWRSFSHWVGGMGVLVFMVAIFPDAYGSSLHILRAEMPGPIVGKLVSKIKITAQILYKIYVVMTVILIILLLLGGMPLFDSILHAFGTAGTGGFGIKNSSIAYYDSAYIDCVITLFMFLFGVNFNLYYFLIIKQYTSIKENSEVKWYTFIVLASAVFIGVNTISKYGDFFTAFRYSAFQVVSVVTTTGYITADYGQWPMFSQIILFILMFMGACAGSTGGGMKVSRIMIGIKNAVREIRQMVHPHSVGKITMDGDIVEKSVVDSANAYFVIYFLLYFASMLIVALDNMDFQSTVGAVTTCLNNIGPGFGAVGPVGNFSELSNLSKIVLSFDMLAGRLELFPFMVLFLKNK